MKQETKSTKARQVANDDCWQWLRAMCLARATLGLTQTEFAVAIGMSKDAVASWETGRNRISRTSALRMSVRLGCNIIGGTTRLINADELIQAQVREFERGLRRRLGVSVL